MRRKMIVVVLVLAFVSTLFPLTNVAIADEPSDWARVEINAALQSGVVSDAMAGSGWQNAASRQSAADAIVRLIEVVTGGSREEIAEIVGWDLSKNQFSDTNDPSVTFLKYAGVTNGIGGNKYNPDGQYTRAEIVTMIGRTGYVFFGLQTQGDNPFTDVPEWAAPYVGYAAERGITQGVGGGLFDPYGVLENQHAAVFVYRTFLDWYYNYGEYDDYDYYEYDDYDYYEHDDYYGEDEDYDDYDFYEYYDSPAAAPDSWIKSLDGYSVDSVINCDLNGDGVKEQVTFFTASNQRDFDRGLIPSGWDLGAHVIVDSKAYLLWFNSEGSTRSIQLYDLGNGKQGVNFVISGNEKDATYKLGFDQSGLKLLP